MPQWYYSPSKNCFYLNTVNKNIPKDAIKITSAQHREMIEQINNNNKKIVIVNGYVTYEDINSKVTWDEIRSIRNKLLRESDYTQLPDAPGDRTVWIKYRQELRDITTSFSDPNKVIWPNKPV